MNIMNRTPIPTAQRPTPGADLNTLRADLEAILSRPRPDDLMEAETVMATARRVRGETAQAYVAECSKANRDGAGRATASMQAIKAQLDDYDKDIEARKAEIQAARARFADRVLKDAAPLENQINCMLADMAPALCQGAEAMRMVRAFRSIYGIEPPAQKIIDHSELTALALRLGGLAK